jgi:hypothetical protein
MYRYVIGGDGQAWNLDANARQLWTAVGWELSNMTGIWAQDHINTFQKVNNGAFPITTAAIVPFNTQSGLELICGFFAGNTLVQANATITQQNQIADGSFSGSDAALNYAVANHAPGGVAGSTINSSVVVSQNANIQSCFFEMR